MLPPTHHTDDRPHPHPTAHRSPRVTPSPVPRVLMPPYMPPAPRAHERSLCVSQLTHLLLQYNNLTGFQARRTWGMHMPAWCASPTHIGTHQDAACHWPPEAPPAASPACSPTVHTCPRQPDPRRHVPGSARTWPAAGHLRLPLLPQQPPVCPRYVHARICLHQPHPHRHMPGRSLLLAT